MFSSKVEMKSYKVTFTLSLYKNQKENLRVMCAIVNDVEPRKILHRKDKLFSVAHMCHDSHVKMKKHFPYVLLYRHKEPPGLEKFPCTQTSTRILVSFFYVPAYLTSIACLATNKCNYLGCWILKMLLFSDADN